MLLKIALPGNHVVVSIRYICRHVRYVCRYARYVCSDVRHVCRGQLSNPEEQYLFRLLLAQLFLPLAYRARFDERALLDTACSAAKARAIVSQLSELHQYNSASPQPRSSWRFYDIALFEAKEVSCIYR